MQTKKTLSLAAILLMVCLVCGMKKASQTRESTDQGIPPITYSVDSKVIRNNDGTFKCRMYELLVTNHTDEALYVTGTYHRKGDSDRVSGHFSGTVYSGQTECLHDEIDVPFNVLTINHERALM